MTAARSDRVLERLRRVASVHWSEVTLDPLIDLWSLAPALVQRLSALIPDDPHEVPMPTEHSDIEQWIEEADAYARSIRHSSDVWRSIAARWLQAAGTSTDSRQLRQRIGRAATLIAEGRLAQAFAIEQSARQLRALLAEDDSAPPG